MGSGINVSCESCDYNKEFFLGIGELYSSLENVINCIHYRRRPEVLDILQNHKVDQCYYEHKLYGCSNCAGLYERFYVKINYDDGKVYETDFMCGKCKTALVEVKDIGEVNNRPCPECSQQTLRVHEHLDWD